MGLKINVMNKGTDNLVVISLEGSLNTDTHSEFRSKVEKELAKEPKGLILDLKSLEYISSMGISSFLAIHKLTKSQGVQFILSNTPEHIVHVFEVVKALPSNVKMFESLEEADQYFMSIQKKDKGEE